MKLSSVRWSGTLMFATLGFLLSLAVVGQAGAQELDDCALFGICDETVDPTNMKITCTGGVICEDGDLGGTQLQLTGAGLPTFQISNTGTTGLGRNGAGDTGTAFLVVVVPSGTSPLNFTASGNTATLLGTWAEGDGLTRFGFLMSVGAIPSAVGPTADTPINPYLTAAQALDPSITGFDVYLVDLGAYTDGTVIDVSFLGIDAFPVGTIFWAFLTDSTGLAVNSTPISQTLVVTPEPGSMILLGTGLLAAGGFLRRRWQKQI